ncbi:hypothetical protein C4J81_12860 [Deltaproteobacteria bacterium Smac51]|nr:hypothetical protein C4J81_12860 [Deltaproteobacteria bacterium Smac51]
MKYEDVNKALAEEFPNFQINKDDLDLPYVVAGDFARFLLEMYQQKNMDEIAKGLSFIENLHHSADHNVQELATIGYLEGIQNV